MSHSAIINRLMQAGKNANQVDKLGNTLLHKAAQHGTGEQVTELLRNKDLLNVYNNAGRLALEEALTSRNFPVFQTILQAYKKENQLSILNYYLLNALLDKSCQYINSKDYRGTTALHEAVKAKIPAPTIIELLIAKGSNPHIKDKQDKTVFDWLKKIMHYQIA